MESFGFIMTRHVNSEMTNKYWNHSVKLLRRLYPYKQIVIIDDNSNNDFIKPDADYKNITIIQSEFNGRGELLPYYYFIKTKFFENAVIIHDSVFFHRRVRFEALHCTKFMPLWFFYPDTENVNNSIRITNSLNYATLIQEGLRLQGLQTMGIGTNKWYGCFGCQSYINHDFLLRIETKYRLTTMIHSVKNRLDRCCLERIMGYIFSKEYPPSSKKRALFGNIMDKHKSYKYTFENYVADLKKGTIPDCVVKVWSGR